ncbi:putative transmembrane protein ZNF593OS [Oncorhynchus tshawytscha]|uniref:putative transmembrane protein ZNF593OS n=1 Tax=Oncorhynchus tshawytscha TaxID=74940 RepID=UPI001C3C695C|nr:putative transmembrane protein ZNF593OS [Oncorhynchus tshawytscha]XP_042160444.1 putative transmembrane protein ZNF593OS [Oncorhynchus tshawytscha]
MCNSTLGLTSPSQRYSPEWNAVDGSTDRRRCGSGSPDQSCINTLHKETNPRPTTDMIIRLGRLTPGYFRLLQRQVAGEVQTQPQDRVVNQIAMMLAIMGLSLSYYSAKRMTEKVQRLQKRRDPHTP